MLKHKDTTPSVQPQKPLMKVWKFVTDDIWDIEVSSLSSVHRMGVKFIRVVHIVFKGFRDDQCPLHASALTFSTLMSLVPVLAVSLALARGLGAGDSVERLVRDGIGKWTEGFATVAAATAGTAMAGGAEQGSPTQPTPEQIEKVKPELAGLINKMVSQIFDYVNKINFTALGGIGLALLLWSVVTVLGNVESSFNKVWGVSTSRPLHRKFFDYMGVLIVLPVLIVAASSLPVADIATKHVDHSTAQVIRGVLDSTLLKNGVTLLLTILACTFLIMFMPNTRVKWAPGLGGGAVAGLLFMVWLWACAKMQVGAVKYLSIYASFAVVPIMLYWVFMSWEILLFGAEVAFAFQNCTTYKMEAKANKASGRSRLVLALSLVKEAARAMTQDVGVVNIGEYSRQQKVPVRLVNQVVDELVQAGLLAEIVGKPGSYVLLKAPDAVSVNDIIGVILDSGSMPSELGLLSPAHQSVADAVGKADAALEKEVGAITLRELA